MCVFFSVRFTCGYNLKWGVYIIMLLGFHSFKFERCIILFIHEGERGLSRGKRMDRTAFYY